MLSRDVCQDEINHPIQVLILRAVCVTRKDARRCWNMGQRTKIPLFRLINQRNRSLTILPTESCNRRLFLRRRGRTPHQPRRHGAAVCAGSKLLRSRIKRGKSPRQIKSELPCICCYSSLGELSKIKCHFNRVLYCRRTGLYEVVKSRQN